MIFLAGWVSSLDKEVLPSSGQRKQEGVGQRLTKLQHTADAGLNEFSDHRTG
jgi:hypothetical protein